ncbi:tocopherol cyclase family protein [Enemella sp. A6]|uniref:tocopherol cyclase family protein n=1 Tax=Enemella sp. A6 TaxID=3440152 RepID=UPI003EC0CB39
MSDANAGLAANLHPARVLGRLIGAYRSTGADLPYGDPLPWHGVSMEGYFWRLTDPDNERVVIALVGINTPRQGPAWATVGIATEPEQVLVTAELPDARADERALGAWVGDHVAATRDHVRFDLDGAAVNFRVDRPRPWPQRSFGGSSYFQTVPGLNQYWHPWLLGGRAHGSLTVDGVQTEVDGWQVYAEKNWGRGGFPDAWWWGQAQGFSDRDAAVAFAGGVVTAGPTVLGRRLSTEVTALVVALPDGRVLRLGNPVTSPVHTEAEPGRWVLHGRSRNWRVDVEAFADPDQSFVLPVPLVEERRNTPGDLEHLVGELRVTVRRGHNIVWRDETRLAALEVGGRDLAEAELARRGGDPRPVRGG